MGGLQSGFSVNFPLDDQAIVKSFTISVCVSKKLPASGVNYET